MNWQWNPLAIPPLISALITAGLIFNTRAFLNLKGAKRIITLLSLATWWNLGYALELCSGDPAWMVILRTLQFAVVFFLPGLFLTYVMAFTGFEGKLKAPFIIALFLLPAASLLLALTNNQHHLFWVTYESLQRQGFWYLIPRPGFGMLAFWLYAAMVSLGIISLLGVAIARAPKLYLRHNSVMVFATVLPLLLGVFDLVDLFDLPYYNLNSVSVAFSVVIMRISLTRFFRYDLTAASRTIIFDSLDNAIFIINRLGDIIDINAFGRQLLGMEKKALIGKPLLDFMPELASTRFFRQLPGIDQLQWLVLGDKTYKVHFTPIKDGQGQMLGSVVSLSDLSTVVQQASDLNTILQTAQQVSSTLDLREVLVRFAEIALSISGYHNCRIVEWDQVHEVTSVLVELNRAVFSRKAGERYPLDDSPTTRTVLRTGEVARVTLGDQDPENTWMAEICVNHLIILPLLSDQTVVGIVEACRIDARHPFSAEEEFRALALLESAAAWVQAESLEVQAEVLHDLAMEISQKIGADLVSISEWDQVHDLTISITEFSALSWELKQGPEHPIDQRPSIARALKDGEITNTYRGDPEISPADLVDMERWGIMSLIAIPLSAHGERIGLLELNHMCEAQRIGMNKLRLLEGIAEHASISIQNARLHRETERKLREQVILKEASLVISSSLELDTVLDKLTEQLAKVVDATSAYLLTYDRKKRMTTVVAEHYSSSADPQELVSDLGVPYEEDDSWFEVIDGGIAYKISHWDDANLTDKEKAHMVAYGAKSILYIPIRFMGSVLGHAEIWESRRKRQFTEEEISLCQAISQQAGSAIEHAIRYQQSQHDATHDALTGLPNRAMLDRRLELAIQRAKRRPEYMFALVYLDLDGFKIVNDSMGHIAGDEFLIEIGRRLVQATRKVDTVSRFGGDEFAILMEDIRDIHSVIRLVERLRQEISKPVALQQNEIVVSSSVGIVLSSDHYTSTMEYLRDADIAMYRAKRLGKARYEVFDQQMRVDVNERLKMEQELRASLEEGRFCYHYQPVYRLEDRTITGVEAFLRWNHPREGLLPPSAFLEVAEETGVLNQVTLKLLEEALQQIRTWNKHYPGCAPLSLSVNITGKQLSQPGFVSRLGQIIQEGGVAGESIHFEITERSILEDFKASEMVLSQIKTLGIKIHLDDFGTGYSSLNYLRQIPTDLVKIDRSLIGQLPHELQSSLCRTILHMAQDLGFGVIAEGVETEPQREVLLQLGCELGQGYLFSPPQDAAGIERILQQTLQVASSNP